jgi:hypothetical protein
MRQAMSEDRPDYARLAREMWVRESLSRAPGDIVNKTADTYRDAAVALEYATRLEAENARLRDLVTEVAASGVEHEAPRYVTVQIGRETWAALRAATEKEGERVMSETQLSKYYYTVVVEGGDITMLDTVDEALDYAKRRVALSDERYWDMKHMLENGLLAEWNYGFAAVHVYPVKHRRGDGRSER